MAAYVDSGVLSFLTPDADGVVRAWTPKYCSIVLSPGLSSENHTNQLRVHATDSPLDEEIEIVVPLGGAVVALEPQLEGCFSLTTVDDQRVFMRCETAFETETWCASLRRAALALPTKPAEGVQGYPLSSETLPEQPFQETTDHQLTPSSVKTFGELTIVSAKSSRTAQYYALVFPGSCLALYSKHPAGLPTFHESVHDAGRLPRPSFLLRVSRVIITGSDTFELYGSSGSAIRAIDPHPNGDERVAESWRTALTRSGQLYRRSAPVPTTFREAARYSREISGKMAHLVTLSSASAADEMTWRAGEPEPPAPELVDCALATHHEVPVNASSLYFVWSSRDPRLAAVCSKPAMPLTEFWVPRQAGAYELSVLVRSTRALLGEFADFDETYLSPYPYQVTPSVPNALNTLLFGGTRFDAVTGNGTCRVSVRDEFGNPCLGGREAITVEAVGPQGRIVGAEYDGMDTLNIVYSISPLPLVTPPGVVIEVKIGSEHVEGSPFRPTPSGGDADERTEETERRNAEQAALISERVAARVARSVRREWADSPGGFATNAAGVRDLEMMMSPGALRAQNRERTLRAPMPSTLAVDPDDDVEVHKLKEPRDTLDSTIAPLRLSVKHELMQSRQAEPSAFWKREVRAWPGAHQASDEDFARLDKAMMESSLPPDLVSLVRRLIVAASGASKLERESRRVAREDEDVQIRDDWGSRQGEDDPIFLSEIRPISSIPAWTSRIDEESSRIHDYAPTPAPVRPVVVRETPPVAPPPTEPRRAREFDDEIEAERPRVLAMPPRTSPPRVVDDFEHQKRLVDSLARAVVKIPQPRSATPSAKPPPVDRRSVADADLATWLSQLKLPAHEEKIVLDGLRGRSVIEVSKMSSTEINALNLCFDSRLALLTALTRYRHRAPVAKSA